MLENKEAWECVGRHENHSLLYFWTGIIVPKPCEIEVRCVSYLNVSHIIILLHSYALIYNTGSQILWCLDHKNNKQI
jgi:hypothetical protein